MKSTVLMLLGLYGSFLTAQETGKAPMPDPGDLFMPKPVTFSFDAPGWYIVGALLLLLLVFGFIKWYKHWVANAYRRNTLKEIKEKEYQVKQGQDSGFVQETLVIVRKVALHSFGRKQIAPLYGNDWLAFLESKGKNTPFTKHNEVIFNAIYEDKPAESSEQQAVSELSKRWIKTHKAKKKGK